MEGTRSVIRPAFQGLNCRSERLLSGEMDALTWNRRSITSSPGTRALPARFQLREELAVALPRSAHPHALHWKQDRPLRWRPCGRGRRHDTREVSFLPRSQEDGCPPSWQLLGREPSGPGGCGCGCTEGATPASLMNGRPAALLHLVEN